MKILHFKQFYKHFVEESIEKLLKAKTEEEIAKASQDVRLEMWNQTPATFKEKFDTWRYSAMLGNPKTHIRNIVGNSIFYNKANLDGMVQKLNISEDVKDEFKKFCLNSVSYAVASKFNIDFSYDDKIFKEYYKKLDEKTLEFLAEYISNATRTIIKTVTIKSNALKYEINIVKEEKGVYNEKEEGGNKDGEGNIVPVEITETIYYGADTGIVPMDFSPTAKVGERRTYTVKRSNEAMGVPSLVGGTLSFATKKRLHKF